MSFFYRAAGVDLERACQIKKQIKRLAATTYTPSVLAGVGPFAGLFKLDGYQEPVLVASADGVGTKIKIACLLNKHDTIGKDLVHHCVNDILTLGAHPLFFLDYLAMGKLVPETVEEIIKGIASACSELGIALLGGETAEMPGFYAPDVYDLVGFIIGVVEKKNIIDGQNICPEDLILGLPSSGLHTNGYSLVRRVFRIEEQPWVLDKYYPELGRSLGEELLEIHRCYYKELKPFLYLIKGLAHITGGGIEGNLSRILPPGMGAEIKKGSWLIPPIFKLIQKEGNISEQEMFEVFNMGLGMLVVVSSQNAEVLSEKLSLAKVGYITNNGKISFSAL